MGRGPAIRPDKAHESGALRLGNIVNGTHILAKSRIALKIDHFHVVRVHIVAHFNVTRRHANDGVVLENARTLGNATGCNFVTCWHLRACPCVDFG